MPAADRPLFACGKVHLSADGGATRASVVALDAESGFSAYAVASGVALGRALSGGSSAGAVNSMLTPSDIDLGLSWQPPYHVFSAGLHVSPVAPHPAKVWAIGAIGTGGAVIGAQLNSDSTRWAASALPRQGDNSSLASTPRFDADLALSFSPVPTYDISLAVDGARCEAVAAYTHHLTVRRRVFNPVAEANVVGIWNYVDLGVEFRRQLRPPFATTAKLGAAWQANKNMLAKACMGSGGASATLAFKSWWDPEVTVSVTGTLDAKNREGSVGVRIGIDSGLGSPEFDKSKEGRQGAAQNIPLLAQPQLSERTRRGVDPEPFAQPSGSAPSIGRKLRYVDTITGRLPAAHLRTA